MADEAGVITLLGKNTSRLETHFARLAGKVEVEIKAILSGQQCKRKMPAGKLTVGERYLLAKKEKYHGVESLSEQGKKLCQMLNKSTAPFWTAIKAEETSFRQKLILRLFYLIEREKVGFFKSAYERTCQKVPQCKFLYTGPWPPYSFANVTLV
ncbi:MAG: GvpL/GvpF family gas vesicle protein [Deltaproteobacteria bacterium]|nr:GvpL/GvpF family gas vesicle protein [Deltaproteobacteria bacterium]